MIISTKEKPTLLSGLSFVGYVVGYVVGYSDELQALINLALSNLLLLALSIMHILLINLFLCNTKPSNVLSSIAVAMLMKSFRVIVIIILPRFLVCRCYISFHLQYIPY